MDGGGLCDLTLCVLARRPLYNYIASTFPTARPEGRTLDWAEPL